MMKRCFWSTIIYYILMKVLQQCKLILLYLKRSIGFDSRVKEKRILLCDVTVMQINFAWNSWVQLAPTPAILFVIILSHVSSTHKITCCVPFTCTHILVCHLIEQLVVILVALWNIFKKIKKSLDNRNIYVKFYLRIYWSIYICLATYTRIYSHFTICKCQIIQKSRTSNQGNEFGCVYIISRYYIIPFNRLLLLKSVALNSVLWISKQTSSENGTH